MKRPDSGQATTYTLLVAGTAVPLFGLCFAGGAFQQMPFTLLFLVPSLIGLGLLGKGLVRLFARMVFSEASVECLTPEVLLGGRAEIVLRLTTSKPITLNPDGCKATFISIEKAHYSAGTSSRTYTETIAKHEYPLLLPRILDAPLEHRFFVEVPSEAPATWSGQHNWLINRVEIYVDIDGRPDVTFDVELNVLPVLAR